MLLIYHTIKTCAFKTLYSNLLNPAFCNQHNPFRDIIFQRCKYMFQLWLTFSSQRCCFWHSVPLCLPALMCNAVRPPPSSCIQAYDTAGSWRPVAAVTQYLWNAVKRVERSRFPAPACHFSSYFSSNSDNEATSGWSLSKHLEAGLRSRRVVSQCWGRVF